MLIVVGALINVARSGADAAALARASVQSRFVDLEEYSSAMSLLAESA